MSVKVGRRREEGEPLHGRILIELNELHPLLAAPSQSQRNLITRVDDRVIIFRWIDSAARFESTSSVENGGNYHFLSSLCIDMAASSSPHRHIRTECASKEILDEKLENHPQESPKQNMNNNSNNNKKMHTHTHTHIYIWIYPSLR